MKEARKYTWAKRGLAGVLSLSMAWGGVPAIAYAEAVDGTPVQAQQQSKTDIQIFGLQVQNGGKEYDGNATANVDQSKLEVYTVSPTGQKTKMPASQVEELALNIKAAFENVSDTPGQRGKDVGENKRVNFEITVGNENYQLDEQGSQLTTTADITAKSILVTWSGYENLTYNGAEQGPNAVLGDGVVSGDTLSVVVSGGATNAGDYTATATLDGSDKDNYTITNDTQNFSIGQLSINDATVGIDGDYYWNKDQQITPDSSNISVTKGNITLTDSDYQISYGENASVGQNAGSVTVTAAAGGNFTGSATGNFQIQKAQNAITIPSSPEIDYNGTQSLFNEGDVSATHGTVKYQLNGEGDWSNNIPEAKTVGTYTIACKVEDGSNNYDDVQASADTTFRVTIKPKSLSITNFAVSDKEYDRGTTATFAGTPGLEGVVSGDSVQLATGALGANFDNANVGTDKDVNFSFASDQHLTGNDASNYTVSAPTSVKANITPRKTWIGGIKAEDKEYDGKKDATLVTSGVTFANLLEGDVLTVNKEESEAEFDDPNVGPHKVTLKKVVFGGESARNYVLDSQLSQTETTANITKAKAKVDLKANDLTYDGSEQELATATATPADAQLLWYKGPEAPKDDKEWSTTAPKAKDAGTYTIWCKAKVTDEQSNYVTGDPTSAKVTIAPAALTVKADAQSKLEGEADPALTYQVSGLKGSDKRDAVVSGALTRDAGEAPGTYAIKQGGVKSTTPNYAIKYAGANLTINALPDTVAISPAVAHVQKVGDVTYGSDAPFFGTTGKSRRVEALQLSLSDQPLAGSIEYRSHVQKQGWETEWAKDGSRSGTTGKSRRLEAVAIRLTPGSEMEKHYDVYYRMHVQKVGWMGWAKNGEYAGTAGMSRRCEAYQVVVVKKGAPAPGATYRGVTQDTDQAYISRG